MRYKVTLYLGCAFAGIFLYFSLYPGLGLAAAMFPVMCLLIAIGARNLTDDLSTRVIGDYYPIQDHTKEIREASAAAEARALLDRIMRERHDQKNSG